MMFFYASLYNNRTFLQLELINMIVNSYISIQMCVLPVYYLKTLKKKKKKKKLIKNVTGKAKILIY